MNLAESFRFAWRGVTADKSRSLLTMLGVLIGVASVISLLAVGGGASATVRATLDKLGSNTLVVVPNTTGGAGRAANPFAGGPPGSAGSASTPTGAATAGVAVGTDIRAPRLTLDDARALGDPVQAPDVVAVAPLVTPAAVTAAYQGASHTVGSVTGTTPSYLGINNDGVQAGHAFSDGDYAAHSRVVLVGVTVAKDLAGGDGSALLDRTVTMDGHSFAVIGILTAKGSVGPSDQDDRVVAPATAVQDTLAGYGDLSSISVKAGSAGTVTTAQAQVERILDGRHGTSAADRDFTVTSSASVVSAASSITTLFTVLLGAIAAISLLVGGIGVMNIMLVTVTERTREIGIRKAIGARKSDIVVQFLLEAVLLSAFGGVLGILVGSLTGLVKVGDFQPLVEPYSIVLAFSFAVAVGLFFGLYPANRAASLKPIDALRYE